ncbi:MAG: hypothetical protein R2849_21785 [Thermomicrobiales bacterium]
MPAASITGLGLLALAVGASGCTSEDPDTSQLASGVRLARIVMLVAREDLLHPLLNWLDGVAGAERSSVALHGDS